MLLVSKKGSKMLEEVFGTKKPVIGVVHLLPLPGSARYDGQLDIALSRAEQEAAALASGGVHGIIIENFFDVPFPKNRVDTVTACAMTLAAQRVKAISGLPLGINVLRNDGRTALSIAAVVDAQFIRINVLTGAMLCDQGIIEGEAHELMLYRRHLGIDRKVKVFADVMVKHAVPIGQGADIRLQAADTVKRALADAIVVSGRATGDAPSSDDLDAVREAVPHTDILIGSGSTKENVGDLLNSANGIIVASSVKRQGILENPVDVGRVRALVEAVKNIG
ncbi:MAG: BtpA/SgcQ family protein [Candidatus Obscuribacterales bacterium]|nr:BtpA/SgcQ family protein [Candidatus Obscuribacterales bacterium]